MISVQLVRPPLRKELGLTPMIDVVFLLLMFFMLAGQNYYSGAVRVQPPVSISDVMPKERVELVVDMDGVLYLKGKRIEARELSSILQESEVINPPAFLVKADADLPVETLHSVLKDLKESGVLRTALATRLKPGLEK